MQIRQGSSDIRSEAQPQSPREWLVSGLEVRPQVPSGNELGDDLVRRPRQAVHVECDQYFTMGGLTKTRPSIGDRLSPRKSTTFGCLHSRMIRHSRSKY